MVLRGQMVTEVSPVFLSVKDGWGVAMKVSRGDRTTAVSMAESNHTRGNPPSRSLYTFVSFAHLPDLIDDDTGG